VSNNWHYPYEKLLAHINSVREESGDHTLADALDEAVDELTLMVAFGRAPAEMERWTIELTQQGLPTTATHSTGIQLHWMCEDQVWLTGQAWKRLKY
jgi:hypothetical protein